MTFWTKLKNKNKITTLSVAAPQSKGTAIETETKSIL